MTPITYLLFAITLNANTGAELERHQVKGTPAYTELEDCSKAQLAMGTQKPRELPQPDVSFGSPVSIDTKPLTVITVYSCVALQGDRQT